MRVWKWIIALLFVTGFAVTGLAAEDKGEAGVRLAVDLADGSHLIGTPSVAAIAIQTAVGRVSLPLAQTRAITFQDDNENVVVTLVNEDRISGVHDLVEVRLTTLFGEVGLPAEIIKKIVWAQSPGGSPAVSRIALIGYWGMDGDGADRSDGGRKLNLVGDVGFADGMSRQALDLHGNGAQFVVRPSDDAVYNLGTNDFTIQSWVNFNSTEREQTLIEKLSGAAGPGWTLSKLSDNRLQFYARPATVLTTETIPIRNGTWHNILVRRAGTLFQIMYDGKPLMAGNSPNPIPETTAPLLIGTRNQGDGRNFSVDGRIDEVAIWLRALSDAEIVALVKGGN